MHMLYVCVPLASFPKASRIDDERHERFFSDAQLQGLENRFERQRYLSTPERIELAALLNLSETQVLLFKFIEMITTFFRPKRGFK